MQDMYHRYKMLKETAAICPEPKCKQIILGWATELQALGYDNEALEVDISDVELSGE
jgi:hypothetical protein